jgi:hypothetical protein
MDRKTFIADNKLCNKYLESKDGKIVCYYGIIPYYYVAIVKSKDKTSIDKHTVITKNLAEIENYINNLKENNV